MKTFHHSLYLVPIVLVCVLGLWIMAAMADESQTTTEAEIESTISVAEPYYGVDLPMDGSSDCPYLWSTDDPADYPPEIPPEEPSGTTTENPLDTVTYNVETGEITYESAEEAFLPPIENLPWDPPATWQPFPDYQTDGRQLISNTTDWPWRSHVKVFIDWPDNTGGSCSGAILDNFHVLTAGHCVVREKHGGWATMLRVAPGYNCQERPYYQAWATFTRTYADWSEDEGWDDDWAVLTLDRNIGYYTGWMGRITCDDTGWYEGRTMNGAGYPGDLNNGQCLYWDVGPCDDAWEYEIETYINTAPGMSGMPTWMHYNGPAYIASIHSRHSCSIFNTGACSTRLNRDKYDRIPYWISLDTPPVDKPDLVDAGPSFSGFGPLTVIPSVTWFEAWSDVRNIGTAEAMAPYNVSYYASTDGEITPADHFIGTKLNISSLYSFHQHAADFAGTFPGNIPAGNYWVGWIIDSGNVLNEFDEGNNVGAKFIFWLTVETPDHTISGRVYTPPNTGIAGVPMTGLPGSPVTDSNGYYSAVVPHQWAGTVTPVECYNFNPHHRTYSKVLWDLTNQNFTAYVKDCSSQDNDCKTGYCDTNDGECHFTYKYNGFPCDDGLYCTVNGECSSGDCDSDPRDCQDEFWCDGYEICDETADACVPGPPPQCDDYVECTIDNCNESTDMCEHVADNTLCDDENICTDNYCAIGAGCTFVPNSGSCDDGSWCSVNDHCAGGVCVGDPKDCSDGIDCTGDSCIEQSQECVHLPRDSACQDGQWCNGSEWCDATAGCQAGNDSCPDDGIFCNGGEWCDELNNNCMHTRPPCNTGFGQTCDAPYETCDEATGQCVPSQETCPDDGLWCNGTELCLPALGACGHTTDISGPQCPSNGIFCDGNEYCEEAGDQCLSSGDPCPDDNLFCNGDESCNDNTGGCDHLNAPDCDDGIPCTFDSCSVENDECDHFDDCSWITVKANGPLFALPGEEIEITVDISMGDGVDDLSFDLVFSEFDAAHITYTGFETTGCLLEGWVNFDCTESGDVISCFGTNNVPLGPGSIGCFARFIFQMDPGPYWLDIGFDPENLGGDLGLMVPEGHELFVGCEINEDCDDGLFCNGEEWCDNGVCQNGEPFVCEDNGSYCDGQEVCDEELQECVSTGNPCTADDLFCNGEEFCNEQLGSCDTTGDPCPDDEIFCNGAESCDEDSNQCLNSGYPCQDDGLFCNGRERCDDESGTCVHTGDPCVNDDLYCNGEESCDEESGRCVSTGDPCIDNGIFCDGVEHCDPELSACIHSGDPCENNGIFCDGTEYCDDALGQCMNTGDPCQDNGLFCDGEEFCNEDTGACDTTGDPCIDYEYCCEDDNYCSNDPCQPPCQCPEVFSIAPDEGQQDAVVTVEVTGQYFACQYIEIKIVNDAGDHAFVQTLNVIDDSHATGILILEDLPADMYDLWILTEECHDILVDTSEVTDGGWEPPFCGIASEKGPIAGTIAALLPLLALLGFLAIRHKRSRRIL